MFLSNIGKFLCPQCHLKNYVLLELSLSSFLFWGAHLRDLPIPKFLAILSAWDFPIMGANYFEATVKWLPKLFRNMARKAPIQSVTSLFSAIVLSSTVEISASFCFTCFDSTL